MVYDPDEERTLVVRPKNLSGFCDSRLMGPSALRDLTLSAARTSFSLASGATSTGMLALMLTNSTRRDTCEGGEDRYQGGSRAHV